MGTYRFLALAVLLLLLPFRSPLLAATPGCLSCHPPHYSGSGGCFGCHRGNTRGVQKRVAHAGLIAGRFAWFALPGLAPQRRGTGLLTSHGCRRCHVIGGAGSRFAASLDGVLERLSPEEMVAAIRTPALYMPKFALTPRERDDLVTAILAAGGARRRPAREAAVVVHFQGERQRDTVFERSCGGCHRLLTLRRGGLGRGEIGPNLSGFFTPWYPATPGIPGRWSVDRLRRWLENPRRLRPTALMPPVPLNERDFEELVDMLRDAGNR